MDSIAFKPLSWVTPSRSPRSLQIWSKSSLINPKPNENNGHLPSTSFTRRLRDFPSSAIPSAVERCDFSCPNLLKRFDFSYPNPFQRCDFSCPNPSERSEFSRSNPFRKRCRLSCLKRFDGPIRLPERDENGAHYYQSSGISMALLGAKQLLGMGAKLLLGKVGLFLAANPMFKTALVSWALAESIKLLLSLLVERKWDFWSRRMPSPLAALWTGLTISVACCYHEPGPDPDPDGLLLLCCFCTVLFIHRSMDGRFRECDWMPIEVQPINRTFNVVQGHTWSQVIAGALLGLLVAIYFFNGPVPAT